MNTHNTVQCTNIIRYTSSQHNIGRLSFNCKARQRGIYEKVYNFPPPFPPHNSRADGYERTSPVGSYPANGYGLVDMIGNVWEWTSSWYSDSHQRISDLGPWEPSPSGCCASAEAARLASIDHNSEHGAIARKVVKGGSYLCAPSYCRRYRPAARMAQGIDTSTGHMGFRCIVRPLP